jgi:NifU-like protein involved in Fe-S cluster formation
MADPDGVGVIRSGPCGDLIKLYLKIDGERIVAAQFKTFGCGVAIASSSALTELLIGKSFDEARALTSDDIIEFFGEVPEKKVVCTRFVDDLLPLTLKNAVKKYPH